jgi:DNA helicase IV
VQDAVARSRDVRRYVDAVWPAVEPRALLYRLLSDAAFLARCADGVLSGREQEVLRWPVPPRTVGATRWTAADAVLLDEIADVLRRTPSLGHVVLDEAQDLSPMQLRAVGRRCATGSATVLGDIAQGTTPWATPSWRASLAHLGIDGAHVEELDRGFRVPTAVIDFAARLLPRIAPELRPPSSVRDDPGSLELVQVAAGGLWADAVRAVEAALALEGSIGVIVPDAEVPRVQRMLRAAGVRHERLGDDRPADADLDELPPRVSLVPATVAKGLEYDHVVVVEPAAIADAEPDERTGLRRLYVVLTRAVSRMTVVHARPLPGPLADGAGEASGALLSAGSGAAPATT